MATIEYVRTQTKELFDLFMSIFPSSEVRVRPDDSFFVARENGELIGFAHFTDRDRIYLRGLGISPVYRNQGLGTALLGAVVEHCQGREIILITETANFSAVKLYHKFGFATRNASNRMGPYLQMKRSPFN
ncbi:TPA: GNAT family N-acetyltransferase [Candidatus Micrarchaeota archaeon]|nr:GNAT family N-acetyltransferase [Candidatus Micrarchaeota archaeon]